MTTDNKYVILMETDADAHESWLYFIQWTGNEEHLTFLNTQLTETENFEEGREMYEDVNVFDLDIENLVSTTTATEMCRAELNSVSYHRRFDGEMRRLDFEFDSEDEEYDKLVKVHDCIGGGGIEDFIEDEFILPEHINTEDSEIFSSDEESAFLIPRFKKL